MTTTPSPSRGDGATGTAGTSTRPTQQVAPARAAGHGPGQHSPSGIKVAAVTLLVPVLAAAILTLFAWPVSELAPRDLPLGIAGPEQGTRPLGDALTRQAGEDAFEITSYADEAAARQGIEDREVYGALVAGPDGLTVLTASAASPTVAQLLTQAVTEQAAQAGPGASAPRVVDVVPTTTEDPRGIVFGASFFPLVLGGLLTGILLWVAGRPGLTQMLGLLFASAFVGVAVVAVAQVWLGAFGGDWWLNAGVLGLTVLAIAAFVTGLADLLGPAGIGLGAVVMMLVGNPLSAVTTAPELLPTWAGSTGQLLPPGAGGTMLRSVAFFDGAAAARPALVLCAWAGFGLLCVALGTLRYRSRAGT
jgi:hypothetical protein